MTIEEKNMLTIEEKKKLLTDTLKRLGFWPTHQGSVTAHISPDNKVNKIEVKAIM